MVSTSIVTEKFYPDAVNDNFDYKNTDILKQFITETGKIVPARVTGISASNQRKITKSIKIARFLALLPYTDMHQ